MLVSTNHKRMCPNPAWRCLTLHHTQAINQIGVYSISGTYPIRMAAHWKMNNEKIQNTKSHGSAVTNATPYNGMSQGSWPENRPDDNARVKLSRRQVQ